MENITFLVAFGAGLLSFLSPCVVPLAPVYLASLCGPEVFDARRRKRVPVFFHSLSFVVGFAIIFTALGAIAGLTGYLINPNQALLNKISGSMLVAFGTFIIAAQKVPWLNYERRLSQSTGSATGYVRSFLIGAIFSMAWTACVGPILGSILALALDSGTAWHGTYLLAIYSLGLGLPFLAIGLALDFAITILKRLRRYANWIQIISGFLLIAVGVLTLMNKVTWFASLAA